MASIKFSEKLFSLLKKFSRFRFVRNINRKLSTKILVDKLLTRKQEHISELIRSMHDPVSDGIEYCSLARKVLCVHCCQEDYPRYDKDKFDAFVITSDKNVAIIGNEADIVEVPPVVNSDIIELDLSKLKPISFWQVFFGKVNDVNRFFMELDRQLVKAQVNLADEENRLLMKLLVCSKVTKEGTLNLENLSTIYGEIEDARKADCIVGSILMHPVTYRKYRDELRKHNYLDETGDRRLILSGYVGDLWAASVRINKNIPKDRVFAMAEPEFLGVMVPHSLIIGEADVENLRPNIMYLEIGYRLNMAIINSIGISQLKITEETQNG